MTINRISLSLKRIGDAPADLHLDENGSLAVVRNAEAVAQHARKRLMAFHGEWFLDKEVGVPWLSEILGNTYDPTAAESVIKSEILETDGVTEIETFSVSFNRQLRHVKAFGITVNTEYDEKVFING